VLPAAARPAVLPHRGDPRELHRRAGGVPVLGGLASARTAEGAAALFCDDQVVEAGAVGLRLDDVELLPCVSQGAAAVGPELTVTAGGARRIEELDGQAALTVLRDVVGTLPVAWAAMTPPRGERHGGGAVAG